MNIVARLSVYNQWIEDGELEHKLTLIKGWAMNGLTVEQIGHNLGISHETMNRYRNIHNDFREALKSGKEVADFEVENALYKRALGYNYEETKIEESSNGKKVTKTTKHVAGDTTAMIFWLKNRKPEMWREKKEQEITGGVSILNDIPRPERPKAGTDDDKVN